MKFSDMMGKRDRGTTEVTEPELPPEARSAPPVPEAPIRFGGNRTELEDAVAAFGSVTPPPAPPAPPARPAPPAPPAPTAAIVTAPAPVADPPPAPPGIAPPSISDVVAELAPRPNVAVVTDQQLDASSWLDGINSIDDDLLPH
jgi:WAS/WASL-interacting protein